MTLKNNRAPLPYYFKLLHHFVAIGKFKLELQSGNAQFGSYSTIFRAVWPWNLTDDLKNNRAHLLCYFKLCSSFRSHCWIQTVTIEFKLSYSPETPNLGQIRFSTSVTLTFDLWPWPFAWTSCLSMVITSENLMMIRWWEHSEKV